MSDRLNWQPPDWGSYPWPTPPPTAEMAAPPGYGAPPPPPPPPGPARGRAAMGIAMVIALIVGFVGVSTVLSRQGDSPQSGARRAVDLPFVPDFSTTEPPRSGPPTTTPVDSASIAARVEDATVDIATTVGYNNGQAAGTGMIITSSGEVLTNNHVIAGATSITVQINGQGPSYSARVLGTDRTDDIAVLKIENGPSFRTIRAGNPSDLSIGDPVVALGNALGRSGPLTVKTGAVSALDQTATASDPSSGTSETLTGLIQTTAPLQPGDSGGPLVNAAGQVVGMNTAASLRGRFNGTTGLSFAIPITQAMAVAADIRAGRASATVQIGQPGFIGIQVARDLTVTRVVPGMPAEAAGLEPGDRILTVEGQPLATSNALTEALNLHRTGDTVTLTWVGSDGRQESGRMKLVAGPPGN